jgi:hypothetical protein
MIAGRIGIAPYAVGGNSDTQQQATHADASVGCSPAFVVDSSHLNCKCAATLE